MVDPSKIQAFGPWVLVKVEPPLEKTAGGIYRPQGNSEDKMGHSIGVVLSVGKGYFNQDKQGRPLKKKFTSIGVEAGDRILFRGFLHDLNRYHQGIEGLQHSMVHADNIDGVFEE